MTPEQLAYLQIPGVSEGSTVEQVLSGSVSGDLGQYGIKLPTANDGLGVRIRRGVPLGALRAAHRMPTSDERSRRPGRTDARHVRRRSTSGKCSPSARCRCCRTSRSRDTLSFEAGYRYSDYNLGFDTDSYKLGLDWAPVDSVRLRGSYQRAVRSPNIQELFLQPRVQLDGTTDPCAGDLTNASTATIRRPASRNARAPV